jgi:O-antigen ligase
MNAMVGHIRLGDRGTRATVIGIAIVALLGWVAADSAVTLSGTKTGAAIALAATVGPLLLYVTLTAPLTFPFGLYAALAPFDTLLTLPGFGTITKALGIAAAGALLFYMLRSKRFVEPPRVVALWILYYLWITATAWWAIEPQTSLDMLGPAWNMFALFFVLAIFRIDANALRTVARAILFGGGAAAAYGIYFFHSSENLAAYGGRLWIATDTSQINPDHFANSLLLPIAVALVATLWTRSLFLRLTYGCSCLLMIAALVLTGSRGAALGFVAIVIFLMVKDRHRVQIAVLSGVAAAGALIASGGNILQRFSDSLASGGAGRFAIWRTGWAAFQQNWLFGAGFGNFPFAYDRAFIHVFQEHTVDWHRASHNILLNTAVEGGVIGLALLLVCWFTMYRTLAQVREDDARYPISLAVQATLIGLFVAGMFADLLMMKYVWLAFILVVITYNARPVAINATRPRVTATATEIPIRA